MNDNQAPAGNLHDRVSTAEKDGSAALRVIFSVHGLLHGPSPDDAMATLDIQA
jgi:hypothetical protein